ncbi:hypothetical protein [Olsenella sp. AGMB03486]|uniref:hypothetical protein n=1 Tax=Olsenella sp. AGMB03486 TaxID=3230364 RepID=UPI0034A06438
MTGHYYFLINPANKEYGFGVCGEAAAGEAAQEGSLTNDSAHFNLKGTYEFPVAVSDDVLNKGVNANVPSTMKVGDSFTPTATLVFTTREWPSGTDTYQIHGTWTSSDSSVLTVASDGTVTAAGAGTATLTLTSQGKTWQYTVQVKQVQSIAGATVSPIADQSYTGSAITPSVAVTLNGTTLAKDTDYTVSYSNNVDPGTATVTITGIGDYDGTIAKSFTICGDIAQAQIGTIADQSYTGSEVKPAPTVTFAGKTLVQGTDYTVVYANNVYPGTASVTVTGIGCYKGTATKSFSITADISKLQVDDIPEQLYTGSEIKPSVTVTAGGRALTEDTDYTVTYSRNLRPGTATVSIAGKGSYTGAVSKDFHIYGDISGAKIGSIPDQVYTGSPVTPDFMVEFASWRLVPNYDYTVSYTNNVDPGTATVTLTGKGDYKGTVSTTFRIRTDISKSQVSDIPDQIYTGSPITPDVTVTAGGKTLKKDTDYTVSYEDNVYRGLATVRITGIGRYTGTAIKDFHICSDISGAKIGDISDQSYTGSSITPAIVVTLAGETLVQDTDYTVSYANNVNPGFATVTIAGKGSYAGTATKTFHIIGKIGYPYVEMTWINDQTYTGSPITPPVSVKFEGKTLVRGTDYTLSYIDTVGPGTASAVITGIGDYTGIYFINYGIYADISEVKIDDIPDQPYKGEAVTPAVTVRIDGKVLTQGPDYKVSYEDNDHEGAAKVTVTGCGVKFRGSTSKTFRIAVSPVPMYRLYNPWSGEHLFTQNKSEADSLVRLGWRDEGIAWKSPSWSESPVYRLYNPYSGDHFYTMDVDEYNYLGSIGWNQEGISFYSASKETGRPIYRLFNRWLTQGTHLFTTSRSEYTQLGAIGWSQEGIAFYSL